jgi:hypothetical protein
LVGSAERADQTDPKAMKTDRGDIGIRRMDMWSELLTSDSKSAQKTGETLFQNNYRTTKPNHRAISQFTNNQKYI